MSTYFLVDALACGQDVGITIKSGRPDITSLDVYYILVDVEEVLVDHDAKLRR